MEKRRDNLKGHRQLNSIQKTLKRLRVLLLEKIENTEQILMKVYE